MGWCSWTPSPAKQREWTFRLFQLERLLIFPQPSSLFLLGQLVTQLILAASPALEYCCSCHCVGIFSSVYQGATQVIVYFSRKTFHFLRTWCIWCASLSATGYTLCQTKKKRCVFAVETLCYRRQNGSFFQTLNQNLKNAHFLSFQFKTKLTADGGKSNLRKHILYADK